MGCGSGSDRNDRRDRSRACNDARFEWVDGYLHAKLTDDVGGESKRLQEDATLARDMGLDAEYVEAVRLANQPGVRFRASTPLPLGCRESVHRNGRLYLRALAADEFCDDPYEVKEGGCHTVQCEDIVIATHNPLVGLSGLARATLLQTKLALYPSHVVAARVPGGAVPDGL